MAAVQVADRSALPTVKTPETNPDARRPVARVLTAHAQTEGGGFLVHRPFPGMVSMHDTDPFLLLDQMGPVVYEPGQARGAPWHPHRGFETVTYVIDGEMVHHDSHGGGGTIAEGDTQWMTAGAGVLHDETPSDRMMREGGRMHGVQLWVNLPAHDKLVEPRYQLLTHDQVALIGSPDGGAIVRLIAGDLGEHHGPGSTYTPITYAHVSLAPGATIEMPWPETFNAIAYVLDGQAEVGPERTPLDAHQAAIFGEGDGLIIRAASTQRSDTDELEVLVLGGEPIREPIAHYGPFVMNTRQELIDAVDDFNAGKMGRIPS